MLLMSSGFSESSEVRLISPFTVALMASLLLGMGFGYSLSPDFQACAVGAGIVGWMYYIFSLLQTRAHLIAKAEAARILCEERLQQQLHPPACVDHMEELLEWLTQ